MTPKSKKLSKGKLAFKNKPVNMALSKHVKGRILLVENYEDLQRSSAKKEKKEAKA